MRNERDGHSYNPHFPTHCQKLSVKTWSIMAIQQLCSAHPWCGLLVVDINPPNPPLPKGASCGASTHYQQGVCIHVLRHCKMRLNALFCKCEYA
jgi:hypothetical protein